MGKDDKNGAMAKRSEDDDEDKRVRKEAKREKKRLKRERQAAAAEASAGESGDDASSSTPAPSAKKEKKEKKEKKAKKDKKKSKKQRTDDSDDTSSSSAAQISAAASSTSSAATDAFRKKNRITVEGTSVPAPLTSFVQARAAFAEVSHAPLDACCRTFKEPSPIQAQAWPIVLQGKDMVGVAETGSGKTLAFILPGLCRMLQGKFGSGGRCRPRALVLAPTRELAMQSAKVAEQACRACANLSAVVVFGGNPKWEQRKTMENCATLDVVVATPGRLLDFVEDKVLDLSNVHYLVLDEADRMLDMGFEQDVRRIIALTAPLSQGRQTVMFSATWPTEIRNLAATFMHKPVRVVVGSESLSASKSVTQHVEVMEDSHALKERKLTQLLRRVHDGKNRVIVFALYKKEAQRLEDALRRSNFRVAGVHGDKQQSAREEAVRKFDQGECPILVATDVASRGLDIKGVEYVINVSFPLTVEDYVHRIGRTGRAGATGEAYTFFTPANKHLAGALQNVMREAGSTIPRELAAFGNTVKKKEHKLYGAHYKESAGPPKEALHTTFDSDSD